MAKKWLRSPADEQAVAEGCTFDLAAADRVRYFFTKFLRHSKGEWAGKPFELLDWQWRDVIAPVFGWKRVDGTRRFRRAGIWVPKKNGKSTLGSGLSLYMLIGDNEPGAEIYNAASDREQASIVFGESANMVEASPALSARLEVVRSTKRIVYPGKAAWYKALSADVPTKEGINWHLLIFDELHAQKTRDLWDTLTYGGAARRQPLLLTISTAGYDRDTIGYEQYQYAKGVSTGTIIDTAFFAYIAEAGEEDDWKNPNTWHKANPSYRVTVKESNFEEDAREAQNSPAKENAFKRYRLNLWTEQDVRWLAMDKWDACAGPVQLSELVGRDCYAGLDLASVTDLAALVLLFPDDDGGYDLLAFFWAPEAADKNRERRNKAKLSTWIKQGLIEATEGDVIDFDVIRNRINQLGGAELDDDRKKAGLPGPFRILEIAIDRWNSTQLATQLQGDGHTVIGFGQGFASMSAPTKKLEELLLAGKIRHGGNAVLRWNAGNVAVETDAAGNLKPSKKRSSEKIDGIVAAIMALGRAMLRTDAGSVYDDPDTPVY